MKTAAMAQVALFMPLALQSSYCSKPLLPQQPQLIVAVLQPHIEGLTQVVTATPTAMKVLNQIGFQPTWDKQIELPALTHLEILVPLALWMLQSFASAVQQQQQQNQDGAAASANSTCSWERMLAAVPDNLRDAAGNFDRFKRQHLQAAALQLARCLLPLVPAGCSAAGVQPAACSSAWRDVVAALVELLSRTEQHSGVIAITPRQLSLCACKLVSDIAKTAPQLLLDMTGLATTGNSNKNKQQQ